MVKIPTILEAGRADGKLVISDAIFDENKNMFQSEINDIQDTLTSDNSNKPLSAKQGKILKELLDNKVIEAGSVPIDTEPIEGNITHLVNSDGLAKEFNKYNTEIILGGIYDVSAHNERAVFESLQVLLSSPDLSTLIPTSVRHGGMSIRFVQSSDNKYVQYRLMSDSFNTTVSNWQGVDDKPTVGRIDDIVESATINDGIESEPEAIVYVKNQKVFAARKGSKFSRYWVGDDAYMTSEGEMRKDKLYTFNGAVYCWDSISESLVPSYSPLEAITPTQIRTDYSENNVSLSLLHGQSHLFGDAISPATQKKAGVMSAEDKKKLDEIRNTVVFTGATVNEETEMLVLNRVDEEMLVLDEVNGILSGGITKVSQLENDKGYLTGAVEGESIMLNND